MMSNQAKHPNKYEVNEQEYFDWLFERYNFSNGDSVLELACGDGDQWENRIPNNITLLLSDNDSNHVLTVKKRFSRYIGNQLYPEPRVIDMQNIDVPCSSYDAVIANRALYMCADMQKALAEIKRVLKPGGTFFTSTRWYRGRTVYLYKIYEIVTGEKMGLINDFTIQNGTKTLEKHFSDVKLYKYDESLHFLQVEDFMDYFDKSGSSYIKKSIDIEKKVLLHIKKIFDGEGCIHISSARGLFVAKKYND